MLKPVTRIQIWKQEASSPAHSRVTKIKYLTPSLLTCSSQRLQRCKESLRRLCGIQMVWEIIKTSGNSWVSLIKKLWLWGSTVSSKESTRSPQKTKVWALSIIPGKTYTEKMASSLARKKKKKAIFLFLFFLHLIGELLKPGGGRREGGVSDIDHAPSYPPARCPSAEGMNEQLRPTPKAALGTIAEACTGGRWEGEI